MKDILPDHMPNPVIVYDSEWKISMINAAAISILGYSKADELTGKHFKDILHESGYDQIDAIRRKLENRKTTLEKTEIRHLHKEGKCLSVLSQFGIISGKQTPNDSRYIQSGIFTDKEIILDQQLKKLQCLKILAENVPGLMMLLIDESHEIQCSVGNEKIKQKKIKDKLEDQLLEEMLPSGIIKIMQPLLEIAFEGTSVSREFKHENDYFSIRITPVSDQNDSNKCVIILQNITESKIIENKIKISKEMAEAANEAKSIFIAKMSHEIRTPLNTIIGFTDQLAKTRLTKKQSTYLDVLNNSSRHLLSTIDDILVLSRVEAGQTDVDEEPFTFENIIKAVQAVFELRVREKKLEFHIQCQAPLKEVLIGDPAKIRQVLINIIGNAIKFTHKGGVLLSCSVINSTNTKRTIRFDISDSGIGMNADELKHIFEPFHQVDNSLYRSYFGTGLGLTISKDLVKSMGGEITVKSAPAKGSTFSFTLTFNKSKAQLSGYDQKEPDLPIALPSKVRILFTDDDPGSRMLGKVILDQYKANCVFASSGDEAVKKFKPGRFDIVLLDINMPGKSGLDVAKHIRIAENNSKSLPTTKIIAMTANVFRKNIKEYLMVGMDDFILKPFREAELIKKIITHTTDKNYRSAEYEQPSKPPGENKDYDLDELLRITRGDKEYTLLMLDTFLENGKIMLNKIQNSFDKDDYRSIAEAAHRLLPSFEQLGLQKASNLLKRIDNRYLKKSKYRRDPELIKLTMETMEHSMDTIRKVRDQFV